MLKISLIAALSVTALVCQTQPKPEPPRIPGMKKAPGPVPRQKIADNPAVNKSAIEFSVDNIDPSVDPCVDFYQYACGNWLKKNPIPPDQSRWGRFSELEERNRDILRQILEQAAQPNPGRDATTQKIGDYYAACMDQKAIDAKGLKPLEPELARIRGLKDKAGLAAEIAHLQRAGVSALFEFGSGPDFKDSTREIAQADQGGLGLPDRDYYLRADPKSVELRNQYRAHIQRTLELAGETPAAAKAGAATVMRLETELAKGSLDRVSRRDPEKVYHKMTRQELEALDPAFRWTEYLRDAGAPPFASINVAWPDFFKTVNTAIRNDSLADWKIYLTWHLLHSEAPLLPEPFVEENFNFYGKILTGATEIRPRWKRCVSLADEQLGEALGKKYVERTFGAEGKERTLKMVNALEKALGEDIQAVTWMTPETKKQALIKLHAITNKIGYPSKWRDYSSVVIERNDALGNAERASQYEFHRDVNKIGKPVDRGEWEMTPPTVNAYYDPLENDINFPAGILQPPFYDNRMDDAVNFGGIGSVIGHELTHGFDDEGSQFGPDGNLHNWWTPADAKAFHEREACFVNEYSKFEVAPGVHVNGKLTLGENTADNGGVHIATMALHNTIGNDPKKIQGFTPEQRYFLSFGQIWCTNIRPEAARLQVQTDPHSPAQFRVNGVVVNRPEFQQAFGCKAGQPMVSANACRVW